MQMQMLLFLLVPPRGQQTTSTFQVQAHALTCLLCWWTTTPASAQPGPPENSFIGNKTSPTVPTVVTRDVRFDDDPPQPSPTTKLALLRNIFFFFNSYFMLMIGSAYQKSDPILIGPCPALLIG